MSEPKGTYRIDHDVIRIETMPNYRLKVDALQPLIREAAHKAGYKFIDTHRQGDGCPDCFVLSHSQRWVAFEIKSDSGALTKAERKLFDYVGEAPLYTVRSVDDFLEIMFFHDRVAA